MGMTCRLPVGPHGFIRPLSEVLSRLCRVTRLILWLVIPDFELLPTGIWVAFAKVHFKLMTLATVL